MNEQMSPATKPKKRWYLSWWAFVLYFIVFIFIISSSGSSKPSPSPAVAPLPARTAETPDDLYRVVKVIDGDTITVQKDGASETLRLVGINTPETVDPRKPVECFGQEASNKAKQLLGGKQVRLEADPTQGERDKYGRLLRYVFLADGTFYNKVMIQEGYAYEYTYDLPYKYQAEFKQAEQEAKAANRGLWADGVCDVPPAVLVPPALEPPPTTGQPSQYICSHNTYNCSDFKTQAEAQAVFLACGGSENDIHKLDQDKDGEACESLP